MNILVKRQEGRNKIQYQFLQQRLPGIPQILIPNVIPLAIPFYILLLSLFLERPR